MWRSPHKLQNFAAFLNAPILLSSKGKRASAIDLMHYRYLFPLDSRLQVNYYMFMNQMLVITRPSVSNGE